MVEKSMATMATARDTPADLHTSLSALSAPHSDQITGPLYFPEEKRDLSCFYDTAKDCPIPCVLCEQKYSGDKARDVFLQHLFHNHKIVIHKTSDIISLRWLVRQNTSIHNLVSHACLAMLSTGKEDLQLVT